MRRGLHPIKSEKEEVSFSNLIQNASTTKTVDIITATDSPTTAGQVEIGDTVNSIFCELNFSAENITNTKIIHWMILKLRTGQVIATPSAYDPTIKRQILKRGMEMLPKDVGTTIKRVFVIKLPRSIKNFQDGDKLQFGYVATATDTINTCGFFIFRHYG